jgi:hypothetical protein
MNAAPASGGASLAPPEIIQMTGGAALGIGGLACLHLGVGEWARTGSCLCHGVGRQSADHDRRTERHAGEILSQALHCEFPRARLFGAD